MTEAAAWVPWFAWDPTDPNWFVPSRVPFVQHPAGGGKGGKGDIGRPSVQEDGENSDALLLSV